SSSTRRTLPNPMAGASIGSTASGKVSSCLSGASRSTVNVYAERSGGDGGTAFGASRHWGGPWGKRREAEAVRALARGPRRRSVPPGTPPLASPDITAPAPHRSAALFVRRVKSDAPPVHPEDPRAGGEGAEPRREPRTEATLSPERAPSASGPSGADTAPRPTPSMRPP